MMFFHCKLWQITWGQNRMFYSCWLVKAHEISILKRYINDRYLPKGNLEKQPNVSKCASSFVGFKLKELTLKDSYGTLLGLVTVPARETLHNCWGFCGGVACCCLFCLFSTRLSLNSLNVIVEARSTCSFRLRALSLAASPRAPKTYSQPQQDWGVSSWSSWTHGRFTSQLVFWILNGVRCWRESR